jgi:hypothetical protein
VNSRRPRDKSQFDRKSIFLKNAEVCRETATLFGRTIRDQFDDRSPRSFLNSSPQVMAGRVVLLKPLRGMRFVMGGDCASMVCCD